MSCEAIDGDLIGYHFGCLPEEARLRVEAHLPTCRRCVEAFVLTKGAIERGEEGASPSEAGHRRLREALAAELGVSFPRDASVPFRDRVIAFAVAASLALAAQGATRALISGPGAPPHGQAEQLPK